MFLESDAFAESALDELNTVWDYWGYGIAAVESRSRKIKFINIL
jgi:hypothetical protein